MVLLKTKQVKDFDAPMRAEMVRDYAARMSLDAMGHKWRCSPTLCRKILILEKVEIRRHGRPTTEESLEGAK